MRIGFVNHAAARHATTHWHYTGSMPVPPIIALGVFEDNTYRGCCVFSRGACNNLHKTFNVENTQICELTRIAMRSHKTPISRIVSIATKILHRKNPQLKAIVSYADPSHGHIGAIYQAGNWIYIGTTGKIMIYRTKDGKLIHSRAVSSTGFKKYYGKLRPVLRPQDLKEELQPGKYKYVLPLDKSTKDMVLTMAKPYPKRVPLITVASEA